MDAGWSFAVLAALTWGASSFFAGVACRRRSTLSVLLVTQLAGLATMSVVTITQLMVSGAIDWASWALVLPWAAVAGLAELLGFAAFYAAMVRGPMGIAAPVAGLGVVVPVLAGLITGSGLGRWQLIGFLVVVVGAALLSSTSAAVDFKTLGVAAVSGAGFGIALVALAQGAQLDEVASGTLMRLITVPLLLSAWWLRKIRLRGAPPLTLVLAHRGALIATPRHRRTAVLPWIGVALLAGIFDALGNFAFALSSTRTSLTVAAIIGSLDPVVTAMLARIWLSERLQRNGRWGAAAAVVGAALISVS